VSFVAKVVRVLRVLAMISLLSMIIVTIVDVTMRMAINELVLGTVELVQFALVATVFLALPETFLRNEHITVDVIDQAASPALLRILRRVAALATFTLVAIMAWRTIPPALDTLEVGDMTSDLQISLFWYWLPVIVGAVTAAVAAVIFVARELKADADSPVAGH